MRQRTLALSLPILLCFGCVFAGQSQHAALPTSCAGKLSADSTIYDSTQLTEKPLRRDGPQPDYSVRARQYGVQGKVILAVVVEPTGSIDPSTLTFIQRVDPELDESASRAVRLSTFWPGCRSGLAVRARMVIPVEYRIGP